MANQNVLNKFSKISKNWNKKPFAFKPIKTQKPNKEHNAKDQGIPKVTKKISKS